MKSQNDFHVTLLLSIDERGVLGLISEAKSGNEDSLMTLYRQYHPLVYALRKKYFLRDLDEQDWLQEGLIIFYGCVQAYEVAYGVSFGALFKRSFENRIRSLIRKECAYKEKRMLARFLLKSW